GADEILGILIALDRARLAPRREVFLGEHALLVVISDGEAGRNGVDVDAIAADLARERARKTNYRRLRADVVQEHWRAAEHGARRDVDDLAAALLLHLRIHGAAA